MDSLKRGTTRVGFRGTRREHRTLFCVLGGALRIGNLQLYIVCGAFIRFHDAEEGVGGGLINLRNLALRVHEYTCVLGLVLRN